MSEIDIDIENTKQVMKSVGLDDYQKLYYKSNEMLKKIFSEIEVSKKDVLTIIGSGDQPLYFLEKDAKSVDLIDKNKLSIYYYFLRRWSIKYLDIFYPEIPLNKDFVINLLKFVTPENKPEMDAYNYWTELTDWYSSMDNMFFIEGYPFNNTIADLSTIKKNFNKKFQFFHEDITKPLNIGKKYDLIYVSNITEHISRNPLLIDKDQIYIYMDNLYNLLNDGGIIIGTNVCDEALSGKVKRMFKKDFQYHEMPRCIACEFTRDGLKAPGYIYKKRKIKYEGDNK